MAPPDLPVPRRIPALGAAVLAAAALALLPACHPRPPKGVPAPRPDFLSGYVGQKRILRFQADRERVAVKKKDPAQLPGSCDAAVEVRSAALDKGGPRFVLESLDAPHVEKARGRCKAVPATITLSLTGFQAEPPGQVTSRIDQLLPTPEGYLRAYGIAFDLPAGDPPAVAASGESNAPDEERRLGRRVTSWPRKLLWVDPAYRDPRHAVRHYEAELEFEAVVGADGRVYRPRIVTGLEKEHVAAILRVLPLWRFEPARAGKDRVPARLDSRLVFRIY